MLLSNNVNHLTVNERVPLGVDTTSHEPLKECHRFSLPHHKTTFNSFCHLICIMRSVNNNRFVFQLFPFSSKRLYSIEEILVMKKETRVKSQTRVTKWLKSCLVTQRKTGTKLIFTAMEAFFSLSNCTLNNRKSVENSFFSLVLKGLLVLFHLISSS